MNTTPKNELINLIHGCIENFDVIRQHLPSDEYLSEMDRQAIIYIENVRTSIKGEFA